ncbi:MAG: uridine kinase [Alicyclobacillaceae bacterium]|nr:uridine kinase [Alicyclobacillaceae bacterium]
MRRSHTEQPGGNRREDWRRGKPLPPARPGEPSPATRRRPVLIGIAGGTGSGKSSVARAIARHVNQKNLVVVEQDAYYRDQSHLTMEQRRKVNYDHPDAFDNDLLYDHICRLLRRQPIDKPVYSFEQHTRLPQTIRVEAKDVIVLEGILVLDDKRLRDLMDIKIFVDTDPDVRVIRRILRDIRYRGRTIESVIHQYLTVVRPMHLQFVEPTKRYADLIIPEGGRNQVAIDLLVTKIRSLLPRTDRR